MRREHNDNFFYMQIAKRVKKFSCRTFDKRENFSRDDATLYEGESVRPSVDRMVGLLVTSYFFGLLGATYAVFTALFYHSPKIPSC